MLERGREHVLGRIQHVDAAILELGEDRRIEHDLPAVGLRLRSEDVARLLHVVADPGRAPHVVDRILVAGVVGGEPAGDLRPRMGEVRQLRLVELLEHARLDLPLEEIGGGNDDVVARLAGEQLGLQEVVRIERVVGHLDAGVAGEILQHRGLDVIGPIVEIHARLLRLPERRGEQEENGRREGADDGEEATHRGISVARALNRRERSNVLPAAQERRGGAQAARRSTPASRSSAVSSV